MPIIVSNPTASKGSKDARRHREKQREAIKKNLPEILADESIITQRKGKVVRIPIRSIEIPRFQPKRNSTPYGVGQGKGKKGQVIGGRPDPQGAGNKPGNEPGEEYIEAEVEIEELIDLMLEELGLPRLEEKDVRNLAFEWGWEIKGIQKSGPWVLLNKRKSSNEGIRRFWIYLYALQSETKQELLVCYRALKQAMGIYKDALGFLKKEEVTDASADIAPFPIFENDDLRYHNLKKSVQYHSQAVVIAMIDVSGSMSSLKKYLARSLLFWLVEFLRKLYTHVDIRFIVHHTEARVVEEDLFFKTGESGGTRCASAFALAHSMVNAEYPHDQWNTYVMLYSDGDDFNPKSTITEIKKLFPKVNMIGYGEVRPGEEEFMFAASGLWEACHEQLSVQAGEDNNLTSLEGTGDPFLGIIIRRREDILPALKAFLRKDRWQK